ncbi:hypothetical protein KIW84_056078 [Lathyrus oleraceus]|uniref:Beta-galactosidase beta-sandwich domain-containing protein n=1 Tax=Pisum sativum TaxID=3888 RepID=A0A9D4WX80_PEA|nr:hypothetical protein KIW84_056078 [Pisum sativum]
MICLSNSSTFRTVGPNLEVAVYKTGSVCAAFLANVDTKSDETVNFSGSPYHLPAWSVSILPDCKNVVLNTAKINSASAISSFVTESSKEDIGSLETSSSEWSWTSEPVGISKDDSLSKTGLLEQINMTADKSDYLWYSLSIGLEDNPGSQTVLNIESLGHALHAFVNGKLAGSRAGNSSKAKLNVDIPITLVSGKNKIDMLSLTVALHSGIYSHDLLSYTILYSCMLGHKEFKFALPVLPIALMFSGYSLAMIEDPGASSQPYKEKEFSKKKHNKYPPKMTAVILFLLATNVPRALYMSLVRQRGSENISDHHYWALVAYTAVPVFSIAAIWFLGFGFCLLLLIVCYFCRKSEPYGCSPTCYTFSLILLILFTITTMIGCTVLYFGQGSFHRSTTSTLQYVVYQADSTVDKLRNVSDFLAQAKQVGIDRVFLPVNVQTDIDEAETDSNAFAATIPDKTKENSDNIQDPLDSVRMALIIIAAVMLVLTFLGFLFSIFGMQVLVYILVIAGWFLVTGTLILCGLFLFSPQCDSRYLCSHE